MYQQTKITALISINNKINLNRTFFIVIGLLLVPGPLFSQTQIKGTLNSINYTIKDGLPSNETYDVFQDSYGFMWIGTDNGVVRFDGKYFETFTTIDGLTDNTIFKISEDTQGRIWFMTYNRKLCFYYNGKFYPYKFNSEIHQAMHQIGIDETISYFYMDSNETIHLCLKNFTTLTISKTGKINIIISDNRPSHTLFPFPGSNINEVFEQVTPYLQNAPKHHKFLVKTEEKGTLHFFTTDSTTYVGTSNGLKFIPKEYNSVQRSILEDYYITGIESDFEGGFWCSTLKSGLIYIPNPNITFYKTDSRKNQLIDAIVPQNDFLIFSMSNNGGNNWVLDTTNQRLVPYLMPLEGGKIPSNELTKGIKFESHVKFHNIGSSTLGLLKLNHDEINFLTNHSFIKKETISPKELQALDLSTFFEVTLPSGETWLCKKNELLSVQKENSSIINIAIPYQFSLKILRPLRQSTGKVLLATTDGLFYLDEDNMTIHSYDHFHEFTKFRIQDIIETNDHSLVFATKANGIFIQNDSLITQYTIKDGLQSNTINQLKYDSASNIIWAASSNGLSQLTKTKNGDWITKSIITQFDGLESQDIRSLYFYNNYLSFINNTGMNLVQIDKLKPFSVIPLLYTQEYLVNNVSKDSSELFSLEHDSNNISISFQAVSYKTSSSIIYQYQLLPNDTLWQKTTNNQLNFNALPPGEYTLNVKATNYYGISSNTHTVHFSIIPAFWMTTWFYLIIVILSLAIGYYISSRSIQIYKNQAKFQRSMKEMHVISLQSKMNPHFIFNSLNSIQNYILKNEKLKANEYLLEFSSLIRSILQNSEQTTITLRKELETLKMYVNLEKKRIRQEFIYTEHIHSTINIDKCLIPTLLIQPYIENAIWHGKVHTNPNGKIAIHVTREDQTLSFEITDNGIGIEQAEKLKIRSKKHKSIGSETTKKRIQLLSELNNEITEVKFSNLDSDLKDFPGTRITFTIPYKESDLPNRF